MEYWLIILVNTLPTVETQTWLAGKTPIFEWTLVAGKNI